MNKLRIGLLAFGVTAAGTVPAVVMLSGPSGANAGSVPTAPTTPPVAPVTTTTTAPAPASAPQAPVAAAPPPSPAPVAQTTPVQPPPAPVSPSAPTQTATATPAGGHQPVGPVVTLPDAYGTLRTGAGTVATTTKAGTYVQEGLRSDHTMCAVTGPTGAFALPCSTAYAEYGNRPGYAVAVSGPA